MQNKTKTEVPYTDDGQVGIRASLKNMGFRDSEIGYDSPSGTVTLNGKALMKPGFMAIYKGVFPIITKEAVILLSASVTPLRIMPANTE